jgi:hypothetical protein
MKKKDENQQRRAVDGGRFQIPPQPKRFSFAGAAVQLCESLAGKVAIYYGETKLFPGG